MLCPVVRAGEYDKVTDALNEEQIRKTCQCCAEAGADFVKTSTGFEAKGATPEVIAIMQDEVGDRCKVKGSGRCRVVKINLYELRESGGYCIILFNNR